MKNGTFIGLNLGENFIPRNLSFFWGADQVRKDNAIQRAKSAEQTRRYEAIVNSDLMTRFSRRVSRVCAEQARAIMSLRQSRNLTRTEEQHLDRLVALARYYSDRFEYYLSKLDRSAERAVHDHFWYYDNETGEVVDDDTGIRYRS